MRIGFLPIVLIGLMVGVVALAYGYFHHYQPNMLETQYNKDLGDQLQQVINLKARAEQRVKDAEAQVAARERAWAQLVMSKTPPQSLEDGGVNLATTPFQLVLDSRTFRDSLQRAINRQVKKGNVTVINGGAEVPSPPQDPATIVSAFYNYPAYPFPIILHDLGPVTVEGTYEQITANVRAWKDMPYYLATTHGLQFTGTSPILRATYSVSLVAYIRGNLIYPLPPGYGGAAAGGGAAGAGGAPRGRRGGGGRVGA